MFLLIWTLNSIFKMADFESSFDRVVLSKRIRRLRKKLRQIENLEKLERELNEEEEIKVGVYSNGYLFGMIFYMLQISIYRFGQFRLSVLGILL